MGDNNVMTCDEIRKRLKPFLEDLLTEDEYQAFVAHLTGCARCKAYVGSIGSVSNQLWELGAVSVPTDFSSTVLFKMKRLGQDARPSSPEVSPKAVIAVLVMLLLAVVVFFGLRYIKTQNAPVSAPTTVPATVVKAVSDEEEERQFKERAALAELDRISASMKSRSYGEGRSDASSGSQGTNVTVSVE